MCKALFGDLGCLPDSQTGKSMYIATFIAEAIEYRKASSFNIELGLSRKHNSGTQLQSLDVE